MTNTDVVARVPLRVGAPVTTMTPGFERLFAASVGVIVLPLYAPDATETVRNLGTIPRVRNPLQRRR
jgi:hypothetical protein